MEPRPTWAGGGWHGRAIRARPKRDKPDGVVLWDRRSILDGEHGRPPVDRSFREPGSGALKLAHRLYIDLRTDPRDIEAESKGFEGFGPLGSCQVTPKRSSAPRRSVNPMRNSASHHERGVALTGLALIVLRPVVAVGLMLQRDRTPVAVSDFPSRNANVQAVTSVREKRRFAGQVLGAPISRALPTLLGTRCDASSANGQKTSGGPPHPGKHAADSGNFRGSGEHLWDLQVALRETDT
jgi:hypothetical protein